MASENEKKPFEVSEKEEEDKDPGDIKADTLTKDLEEEVEKREEEAKEAKEQIEEDAKEEEDQEPESKSKIFKYALVAAGLFAVGFAAWSAIKNKNEAVEQEQQEQHNEDLQPIPNDFMGFGG